MVKKKLCKKLRKEPPKSFTLARYIFYLCIYTPFLFFFLNIVKYTIIKILQRNFTLKNF